MKIFLIAIPFLNLVSSWLTIDDLPILGEVGCKRCERVYAPVCASDNKTYTNECRMNCHNLYKYNHERVHIKRYGRCVLGMRRNEQETQNITLLRDRALSLLYAWKKNTTSRKAQVI